MRGSFSHSPCSSDRPRRCRSVAAATPAALAFAVRDLGNLGDPLSGRSTAEAVMSSDSWQVPPGAPRLERAFRWNPATRAMTDLGTLGGFGSQGAGINDLGHVAGAADTAGGDTHAFRWDPLSGMTDLGTLGGSTSRAFAINNLGVVVGESLTAAGVTHAFRWDPRTGG